MKKENSYHHGNLKQALIEESFKIIRELGIEAITLRELAKRLNISSPALYRHFKSKDELFQHVLLAIINEFEAHTTPIFTEEGTSTLEKIKNVTLMYVQYGIHNPDKYRLIFGNQKLNTRKRVIKDLRPDLHSAINNTYDLDEYDNSQNFIAMQFIYLIQEAQKENLIVNHNPHSLFIFIWSSLHGLVSLIINGHEMGKDDPIELFNDNFKIMLNTLLV